MSTASTPPAGAPDGWDRHLDQGHLLLGWEAGAEPDAAPTPIWLENTEAHTICVGATGSGKGVSGLLPTLLSYRGSTVVVDVKGEACAITARYRREVLGQRVVRLDPFGVLGEGGDSLNPLDILGLLADSVSSLARRVPPLLADVRPGSLKDPFWTLKGDGLLTGVVAYLLSGLKPEQAVSLEALYELMAVTDFPFAVAKLLDTYGKRLPKAARREFEAFLGISADVTRAGVLATATQHLSPFADEEVALATGSTSFDLEGFRDGAPTTVYLVLPPHRLRSHASLLRLWLVSLMELLMTRRHRVGLPTYFLIDEVAHIGALPIVETAFTLMRGYGVRVGLFVQDLPKLRKVYPDAWETMLANTGVLQCLRPRNNLVAKDLAKLLPSKVKAKHLMACPPEEQYLLDADGAFAKTRRLVYYRDACFAGTHDANPYRRDVAEREAPLHRANRAPLFETETPSAPLFPAQPDAPLLGDQPLVPISAWGGSRVTVVMPGVVRDN